MADGVNKPTNATDDRAAQQPLGTSIGTGRSSVRREQSPHALKFLIATTSLAVLAVIAVAVAVVTAHNSQNDGPLPAWSSWSPPDTGIQGARDIADHLAPFYRITNTDQLAAVTVLNVANPNTSSSSATSQPPNQIQIALKAEGSSPSQSAVQLLGGHTIAYNLCGLGTANCSIGVGTTNTNQMLLLRREGLELALYTFHYLPGIDNVVAVLPPGKTLSTSTLTPTPPSSGAAPASSPLNLALLFDRQELQPFTSQPLSFTLPLKYPPGPGLLPLWRQTQDAGNVDQLTARGLFTEQFEHAIDGSYLLVLTPAPPQ
jgi:hypothetical protein